MQFAIEKIDDIWGELQENYQLHWDETEGYRHGQGLNMDKARYLQYEGMGLYFMYTARIGGVLAGNLGAYVMHSMHTGALIATEDTLFMKKEYRRSGHSRNFLDFVENDLFNEKKVVEINVTVKAENKASLFVESAGYDRIGYQYSKTVQTALPVIKENRA